MGEKGSWMAPFFWWLGPWRDGQGVGQRSGCGFGQRGLPHSHMRRRRPWKYGKPLAQGIGGIVDLGAQSTKLPTAYADTGLLQGYGVGWLGKRRLCAVGGTGTGVDLGVAGAKGRYWVEAPLPRFSQGSKSRDTAGSWVKTGGLVCVAWMLINKGKCHGFGVAVDSGLRAWDI